jgi:uncharacterized protein (UPF0147 family)
LAAGKSDVEVARACKKTRETIRRWKQRPDFTAAVASAKDQMFDSAVAYANSLALKAYSTLEELMDDKKQPGTVRRAAAEGVLTHLKAGREHAEYGARLSVIEKALEIGAAARRELPPWNTRPEHEAAVLPPAGGGAPR